MSNLVKAAPASLFELEEGLTALLDTEALVDESQQAEFQADLAVALAQTVAKRDRVGDFLRHCEMHVDGIDAEINRLTALRKQYRGAADRLQGYVLNVILALGKDEKGEYRKLEGSKVIFRARRCPASVEIQDAFALPEEAKVATITIPGEFLAAFVQGAEDAGLKKGEDFSVSTAPSKSTIKAMLTATPAKPVPGAVLVMDKMRLEVR